MTPGSCRETSVNNYKSTPRNIPEERRSYLQSGRSLTSRTNKLIFVISVFRCDVDEIGALLGYYTVLSGCSVPTFWGQPIGPIFKCQEVRSSWTS